MNPRGSTRVEAVRKSSGQTGYSTTSDRIFQPPWRAGGNSGPRGVVPSATPLGRTGFFRDLPDRPSQTIYTHRRCAPARELWRPFAFGHGSAEVFLVVADTSVAWVGVGAEGPQVFARVAQNSPGMIRCGVMDLQVGVFSILSGAGD